MRSVHLTLDINPYKSPTESGTGTKNHGFDRRFVFLLFPSMIPLAVHCVVRVFIPVSETRYHAMFTLGAIIPAWVWAQTMVDRLNLSFWKTYLAICFAWGAVLASAVLSPALPEWFVVGP